MIRSHLKDTYGIDYPKDRKKNENTQKNRRHEIRADCYVGVLSVSALVGDEDAQKLFQEIKVKAEADKDAQHNLGVMYERGEGVQQKRKEAVMVSQGC